MIAALAMRPFDLDAALIVHQGNLAVAHEAQYLLTDAARAIARVQFGCVEQVVADTRATLAALESLQPDAAVALARSAVDRTATAAGEIVGLTCQAQLRVRELLSLRLRTNLDEFSTMPAAAAG